MELGVGSTCRIGYVTESFTTRDRQPAKTNKIISFSEAFDEETAKVEQPSRELAEPVHAQVIDKQMVQTEDEVWEAKDRLHAAQTAANYVASIFQGTGKIPAMAEVENIYGWLLMK
ncbi:MAG: hypothetical protein ACREBU_23000, partial [Nitrososphaera sp.]